jgi:hypothetical protein
MAKKKKRPKAVWTWAPDRRIKPKVPEDLKAEVQAKADELVERVLKPHYIKPPPKNRDWNYPIDIWTKWHKSFFYFSSTWASPGPNRIAPSFEVRFARLEYVGDRRFNLAYFRHTGQWWQTETGLTLGKCLKLIEEGGPYTLI